MEFYADDNHGIGFYVDYPDNNNAAHLEQIRFDMYKITKDLKKT